MNIVTVEPHVDPLWSKLVCRQRSDVFQSPAWIRVLKDTYDFDIQALVVLDDADSAAAEPRAGIAFASIDDMMDPRIVSLPFSDFCDPLVQDQGDWDAVVGRLLANEHRLSLRCLHNQIPLDDERLTQANRAKWHAVDLRRDVDDIWQDLHGSARRAIRKARRNVTVRRAQHKGDLRAFFELHLGLRKYKYELLAQPYRFFEHIWDHFIAKDKGALMLAVHESHIIAGVLFLEWQDKLYYKFNASAPESVSLRPNDLIVWEGIKYGQRKGYEYLDFGLSDWDQEGLLRYKRKFATEEKTISFLTYTPGGSPSQEERQMRALLPQITDLFVDETVPDCITERAGEVLYRFFT